MPRHRYRLGSVDVVLLARGAVATAAEQIFDYLGVPRADGCPPAPSHVLLALGEATQGLSVPDDAREIVPATEHGGAWESGPFTYVASSAGGVRSVVRVDSVAGRGDGFVHPDLLREPEALWRNLFVPILWGLFVLLRPHRLYALHAAALGRDGRGLLLVAESDCGKSTLAYSLVREGWAYLSDDTVLLDARGPLIEAVPLRRRFGLDAVAGQFFPELESVEHSPQLSDRDKWAVDVDLLLPGLAAAKLPVDVLVLPQIVEADESRVEPAPAADVHLALICQALSRLDVNRTRDQIEALAQLVRQTRHYRLLAGRDIIRTPARASELLSPLLHADD